MKKTVKYTLSILLVFILLFSVCVPAFAEDSGLGWQETDGKTYYYLSSDKKCIGVNRIDDKWYYFDNDGVLFTGSGWIKCDYGSFSEWNYAEDGVLCEGWKKVDGKWYYFSSHYTLSWNLGAASNGGCRISDTVYVFNSDGSLADDKTGWKKIGRNWYYLEEGGKAKTGWFEYKGEKYYFNDYSGFMRAGYTEWTFDEETNEGCCYLFENDGTLTHRVGWVKLNGYWFYVEGDGKCKSGWLKYKGSWYYINSSGYMCTDMITGDYYYVGEDGKWDKTKTGWFPKNNPGSSYYIENGKAVRDCWKKIDGKWYRFLNNGVHFVPSNIPFYQDDTEGITIHFEDEPNPVRLGLEGDLQMGWQKINDRWYYFKDSPIAVTSWQKINGKWYYFDKCGVMKTGWVKDNGKWYYLTSSGAMKTGWLNLNGKWYYFSSSGAMVTGTQKIGNKTYNFNSNGVCLNP